MVLLRVFSLLANDQFDGGALKSKRFAQAVFNKPLIGKMEQLRVVAKDDKGGRRNRSLRHVIDLQASALIRRRLNARDRVVEHVIEHSG